MTRKDAIELPPGAEALLKQWPLRERGDEAWDASARAIDERIRASSGPPLDDGLLGPPLPLEPGEPGDAPPVSLAELARQSLQSFDKESEEALAREALAARRASQPIADSVRGGGAQIAARAAATTPTAPAAPRVEAEPLAKPSASRGPWIAAGLGLAGLAIASAIVLSSATRSPDPVVAAQPTAQPTAPSPPPASPPKAEPEAVALEQLPGGDAPEPSDAPGRAGKVAALPHTAGAKAGSPAEEHPGPIAEGPTEPAPKPAAPSIDPEEKLLKPAAQPTDVPQKPSIGAANAAIGAVLGGARACVAGHPEPSRATLVFESEGRVRSVAVSGPAAGTQAEACIRSALSKARLDRFASPTFTISVTVRP